MFTRFYFSFTLLLLRYTLFRYVFILLCYVYRYTDYMLLFYYATVSWPKEEDCSVLDS
jgi:hypothetical protein